MKSKTSQAKIRAAKNKVKVAENRLVAYNKMLNRRVAKGLRIYRTHSSRQSELIYAMHKAKDALHKAQGMD